MTSNVEIRIDDNDGLWVWVNGRPVQPGARVTLTAEELAILVREHAWAGIAAGRKAGAEATEEEALRAAVAVVRASTAAAVQAGATSVAQATFNAGAKYAAESIARSSVVRRRVERGPDGQIIGTVEYRGPVSTEGGQ